MRIIPVIDLMGGVVVRAVAGRRHEYRPVRSPLVDSPNPLHVAERLLEASGATALYVADLDAIMTADPVEDRVRDFLTCVGVEVLFDGGFRTLPNANDFPPPIRPVIASETFGRPASAGARWAFSIDLNDGEAVGNVGNPVSVAADAVAAGFRTLIVLDVARVGTDTGPGTGALLGELRARFPEVKLIAGGGIRGADDLARLTDLGIDAVLVASALHDGRLRG